MNYVAPLWLLFWSALINRFAGFLPSFLSQWIGILGTLLGIMALVRLAPRNGRLAKAKRYMFYVFGLTLFLFICSASNSITMAVIAIPVAIAFLVLSILCSYHRYHGLADMATEAGDAGHASKLRMLFRIEIITMVAGGLIGGVWVGRAPWIRYAVLAASSIVTLYQLYLYHGSIKLEAGYARGD